MKPTKLDINDIVRTKAIVLDSNYPDEVVNKIVDGLDDLYEKAKAMDEIEQAYWQSNTPENFAYEFVGIFEKHFSNELEDE